MERAKFARANESRGGGGEGDKSRRRTRAQLIFKQARQNDEFH